MDIIEFLREIKDSNLIMLDFSYYGTIETIKAALSIPGLRLLFIGITRMSQMKEAVEEVVTSLNNIKLCRIILSPNFCEREFMEDDLRYFESLLHHFKHEFKL